MSPPSCNQRSTSRLDPEEDHDRTVETDLRPANIGLHRITLIGVNSWRPLCSILGHPTDHDDNVFYRLFILYCYKTVRLLLTQKFSKIRPASGALPQTPLYTAYTFFEKYILHSYTLNLFWSFFTLFASPTEIVQFLLPQPKNCSRAYVTTSRI